MIAWDHPWSKAEGVGDQPDETFERLVIDLGTARRPPASAPVERLQMMLKRYEADPAAPPATGPA